jgi:hypothetical protein
MILTAYFSYYVPVIVAGRVVVVVEVLEDTEDV